MITFDICRSETDFQELSHEALLESSDTEVCLKKTNGKLPSESNGHFSRTELGK